MADYGNLTFEDHDFKRFRHVETVEQFRQALSECTGMVDLSGYANKPGLRKPAKNLSDAPESALAGILTIMRFHFSPTEDGQHRG